MAKREVKLGNIKGPPARFINVIAKANPTHLDDPTVDVELESIDDGQNLTLTFNGLQGPRGEMGPVGDIDVATNEEAGKVKPDGKTIKIKEDGTLYLDLNSLKFEVREDGHLWVSYDDGNEG